jgi:hypothetical protein
MFLIPCGMAAGSATDFFHNTSFANPPASSRLAIRTSL